MAFDPSHKYVKMHQSFIQIRIVKATDQSTRFNLENFRPLYEQVLYLFV